MPNAEKTILSKKMKFCSSCSRDQIGETGRMILTSQRKERWICASCHIARKNRSGSSVNIKL